VRRPGGRIAYGIGTTEYMRSRGGYAVTVECGQHADPTAPAVARAAIDNAIALLGLEAGADAPLAQRVAHEVLEMSEVVDRQSPEDHFAQAWRSFDPVKAGQVVAFRADGEAIVAPEDGHVVFPNTHAPPGREWFYFARPGRR
jgi:succinylglutamate desuccinylase